jgi:hypothetical protein
MEGYCSTGQSPQRAVVPMEEEEEERSILLLFCKVQYFCFKEFCFSTDCWFFVLPIS